MKIPISAFCGALSLVGHVSAFFQVVNSLPRSSSLSLSKAGVKRDSVPFDARAQLVSTDGAHAFVPPGPNDARGPCPGLNAMANHGYLPHNGYATIAQFQVACLQVFGMGIELATILSAFGAAFDGNVLGWSIAGIPHTGIGGSHGNYESDSSPMRGDLYQYGSNTNLVISQFQDFYNMQPDPATANYNLEILREFRRNRYNQSIEENPYFYYGPFSGTTVTQAAFAFIYRFMANKSVEAPEGILNKMVLKSFMSIQGPEDNLKWVPGNERIPDNWYTRNVNDLYDVDGNVSLSSDITYLTADHPELRMPGCNTGTVNNYTRINVSNLTKNAYSPDDVLTNPFCFGLAFANAVAGSLNSVVEELLLPIQNALSCKTIPALDMSTAEACPGYSFYGGPSAPIAPGAIRN